MVLIQAGPCENPNDDSCQGCQKYSQKPVVNRQQEQDPCPHPQARCVEYANSADLPAQGCKGMYSHLGYESVTRTRSTGMDPWGQFVVANGI